MNRNEYISSVISNIGFAIDGKKHSEIIVNYRIKLDKKNMKFHIENDYSFLQQPIGSFLADYLNVDFDNFNSFYEFFIKYPLPMFGYDRLMKQFGNNSITAKELEKNLNKNLELNKSKYKKLQTQLDMIIDYCLVNPTKKASNFSPIERLYVLRNIDETLTILYENKAEYYTGTVFSSFPGNTEKEIYDFLSKKKNHVDEYNLIIPLDLKSLLYNSILNICKKEVYLKSCKNCNKYFIAINNNTNYCNNIVPNNKKKTCKDIGKQQTFKSTIENDKALKLYYNVYNRKVMMKSRNPDIISYTDNFEKYKRIGHKKLLQYKANKITQDEFINWINKNI